MIFDLVTVTVSIALLTVLTARKSEIFSTLQRNSILSGTLLTILQMIIFVGTLEKAQSGTVEVSDLLVMFLIRLRPLLFGALYKLLFILILPLVESAVPELCRRGETKDSTKVSTSSTNATNTTNATNATDETKVQRPDLSVLSRREIEVARLAAKGYTNAQIAETLFISSETVKRHMATIFEKLNISSRKELMLKE